MTDIRIATLLKFISSIKWLALQSWCTCDALETFLTFSEGVRCCTDTINERKRYSHSIIHPVYFLKWESKRGGSWMKRRVLYKPKHNKTVSQQSPDSWLFAIILFFVCRDTFVGVYNTTEKIELVQHTWDRISDFQTLSMELLVYIDKTQAQKFVQKKYIYAWQPGERELCFFLL